MDIFDTEAKLRAEIKRLQSERDGKIQSVKVEYRKKLDIAEEKLRNATRPRPKPSAMERWTEPEGPVRTCKKCTHPLLRATEENVRLMMDANPKLYSLHRGKVNWANLRTMQKAEFCCHRCATGQEGHSLWCTSIIETNERLEEEKD